MRTLTVIIIGLLFIGIINLNIYSSSQEVLKPSMQTLDADFASYAVAIDHKTVWLRFYVNNAAVPYSPWRVLVPADKLTIILDEAQRTGTTMLRGDFNIIMLPKATLYVGSYKEQQLWKNRLNELQEKYH